MLKQQVLPAISDPKKFEIFMSNAMEYCILMDMTLEQVEHLCKIAHQGHKKCLVHMDLIKGLRNDEYGAIYMCQKVGADGLISTHPPVISQAKKKGKIAILRVFLIDTRSLEKSINIANNTQPDFLELLPALAYGAFSRVQEVVNIPMIAGGLIRTKEEVEQCLAAGVIAVTTSQTSLWMN
jgi:glycerol uptake operon antiterminator